MRLADHGSTVLASARDAGKLAELEAASNDLVGHIIALPLDVTDNDGVRAAYEGIFLRARGARSLRSQRRDIYPDGWGHFLRRRFRKAN